MSARIVVTSDRILDPASGWDGPGWLAIENGFIAARGDSAPPAGERVDLSGLVLAPGLIDVGVDIEDGAQDALIAASATAGITLTIVRARHPRPLARPMPGAPYALYATPLFTRAPGADTVDLAPSMARHGRATPVIAHAGPDVLTDTPLLLRGLAGARALGRPVLVRPVDAALSAGACVHENAFTARLGLSGAPEAAETLALARLIEAVRVTGARVHLERISSARGAAMAAAAKDEGLPISAGVAVANLRFNALDIGLDMNPRFHLTPPLREEDDRTALIAATQSGALDVIASGHTGVTRLDKDAPFPDAVPGGCSAPALLAAALETAGEDDAGLLNAVARVTYGPAQAFGFISGQFTVGAPADLAAFDPNAPWKHAPGHAGAGPSPFDGRLMTGAARLTVVGGTPAYDPDAAWRPS